jgi:large subunit ribosomal protein L9
MKLLLKENLENLGKKGDIVTVAPGYGRNYLIPKKLAIKITPSNMKMIEIEQEALRKGLEKEMESYNEIIERLNSTDLVFIRKTSEKDTIYGSVSANDIKESLDKLGIDIEKKRILLDEPIKKTGKFTVPVKVFQEHQGELKVEVRKEGKEEEVEKKDKKEIEKAVKKETKKETKKEAEKETKKEAEEKDKKEAKPKKESKRKMKKASKKEEKKDKEEKKKGSPKKKIEKKQKKEENKKE